jgi:hypothetical protein
MLGCFEVARQIEQVHLVAVVFCMCMARPAGLSGVAGSTVLRWDWAHV